MEIKMSFKSFSSKLFQEKGSKNKGAANEAPAGNKRSAPADKAAPSPVATKKP